MTAEQSQRDTDDSDIDASNPIVLAMQISIQHRRLFDAMIKKKPNEIAIAMDNLEFAIDKARHNLGLDGRKKRYEEDRLKQALAIAADALEIAADWDLPAVQATPPKDWNLSGGGKDAADGWCSTRELARKLRELAS